MISFLSCLYNMIGGDKMLKGIDISHHQQEININNLNVDFVIVKATEGVGYSDPNYEKYLSMALESNKKIGVYHYARPDLKNTPEDEATWFINKVTPYIKKAILVLDWEVANELGNTTWAERFLQSVYKKTSIKPLIYMSSSVANNYNWQNVASLNYGLWIANYGANTGAPGTPPKIKYWPFYTMWQYTSQGHISGYSGNLDLNYFYGDKTAWSKYANPDQTPEEPKEKYEVGDVVNFNYLYKNSYGEGKVTSLIKSGTITRIIENRKAPYLINRGAGWLSDDLIIGSTKEELTIGSKVKTIEQGNASSDGTSNKAKKGITGTITKIIPGAKFPYLISSTVPLGWYQKSALEKI